MAHNSVGSMTSTVTISTQLHVFFAQGATVSAVALIFRQFNCFSHCLVGSYSLSHKCSFFVQFTQNCPCFACRALFFVTRSHGPIAHFVLAQCPAVGNNCSSRTSVPPFFVVTSPSLKFFTMSFGPGLRIRFEGPLLCSPSTRSVDQTGRGHGKRGRQAERYRNGVAVDGLKRSCADCEAGPYRLVVRAKRG